MISQATTGDPISALFTLSGNFPNAIAPSTPTPPSISTSLTYRAYSTVVTWTHNFGSNLINQVRAQFSPGNSSVTAPPEPAVTGLIVSGLAGFGRYFGAPYIVHQQRYQFEDNVTMPRGKHTFKFGAAFRPVKYNFRNDLWFAGEYQFQASAAYAVTLAVPSADRAAFLAAAPAAAGIQLNPLQNLDLNLPFLYRQGFHNPLWIGTGHYVGGRSEE